MVIEEDLNQVNVPTIDLHGCRKLDKETRI